MKRVITLVWAASLGLALSVPDRAQAQLCDPELTKVSVSVTVGDGSEPEGPNYSLSCGQPGEQGYSTSLGLFPWGSAQVYPSQCPWDPLTNVAEGAFKIFGQGPYASPPGTGWFRCTKVGGCPQCEGSLDQPLYASYGSFRGQVTQLPDQKPAANVNVRAFPLGYLTHSDASGNYDFARESGGLWQANSWAVKVFGDGLSTLQGDYTLSVEGHPESERSGTTFSSTNVPVDLAYTRPGTEDPSTRSCGNVGQPVNVATGNAWLDQTDVRIPGVGAGLEFTRSYNSVNRGPGQYGMFGAGWFSTYEQRLTFPPTGIILLRQGDGVPTYFQDVDTDGTYDASVPFTKESTILKVGSGPTTSYTRRFRAGGSEVYDASGRLLRILDASGNAVSLSNDPSGRLSTITTAGTDPSGDRTLTLSYTGDSTRPDSLSGPAGLIATYTYDSGRLASVTYPQESGGFSFTYDPASNLLLTVKDGEGRFVESHSYYPDGRTMTSEISDGQEKYTLTYEPLRTTVTDALNNVTTYEYTNVWGMKRLTKVTGPCSSCAGGGGEVQEWTYDNKGRVKSYKDAPEATTAYTYNEATGDLLKEEKPLNHITRYTYWPDGRVHTKEAPNGAVTTYTYVAAGPDIITETVDMRRPPELRTTDFDYTPAGKVEFVTDPRGKKTQFVYDSFGDLRKVIDPLGTATPDPHDHTTRYDYDPLGRRTAVTDPMSSRTETGYDPRGRVVLQRQFDEGRPIDTTFGYDKGGLLRWKKDALGRQTDYDYDLYRRLWHVHEPRLDDGTRPVTTYGYDLMSTLTSITDAENHTTTFEPDAYHRVHFINHPGGVRGETFEYDTAGRLWKRSRGGVMTTYGYDDLSRLTTKTFSDDSPGYTYTYDENGDVGFLTSASVAGHSLEWNYDLVGQVRSEIARRSTSGQGTVVAYSYDPAGNRESLGLNGLLSLTYEYDDASRLDKIRRGANVVDFGDDDANRRKTLEYPNAVITSYDYDDLSRLKRVAAGRGQTTVTSSAYTYDDVGNRLTKTHPDYAESYDGGYDSLDRLKDVYRGTAPALTLAEHYTYDSVGNRKSSLSAAPWEYNERNQLLSYGSNTFGYDGRGNLASKTDSSGTWTYEWNAENQLTRVLLNGSEASRFVYDALARRVEKIAGGVTTRYTYDGEDILGESASTGTTVEYIHGPGIDEPLAQEDVAGVLSYFHADGLGSIIRTTDSTGAVIASQRYDAFGNFELGATNGFAFTGREWDPETGLYYYRARYYDPKIGRFLSEDPIRFEGGVNFYAYVGNNPVLLTDPTGEVILVCNRKAEGMPGNHTYLYDPATGRNCGRGNNSGKENPIAPTTACVTVPGSDGMEDRILKCCEEQRKHPGIFFPPVNDCHVLKDKALECAGVPNTPAAGGRMGCPTCPSAPSNQGNHPPPCDACHQ